MILAVDIGNSNICIGGLDGMKVLFTARMVARAAPGMNTPPS